MKLWISLLKRNSRSLIVYSFRTMSRYQPSNDNKPVALITRRVPTAGEELLSKYCQIRKIDGDLPPSREELLKQIKDVDALFCLLTDKIDSTVLDAAGPNLKVIGTMSVGYDHIDIEACKSRGIPVGYTPEVLTDATAELTVALLLNTSRRLSEGVHAVKAGLWGTWQPLWLCGQGLHHSTVGIVGLGRIGLAIGRRLQPFGVDRFLYTGNTRKETAEQEICATFVSMDELLEQSDFVIVSCALTDQTKGMFNTEAFKKMKRNAILVNTSRGPVVNQDDLYLALKSGEIRAAGLDVTTPEPLPVDNPLLQLDNCVVLPHIGSATEETRSTMSLLTARNIIAALNGEQMPCKIPGT
ncbi:glyoxylate reductase/hydroxypyruvate reductase-like [Tubulanus polymorphus]|uniref:glyoxylate reductase/hydroxypyruvate reductase-like n=1 Tax=Tubulanus polymorphus TaxID=672921 RepID=UPI003DA1D921